MAVRRYDAGSLKRPERLPNGYVRADGYLTRAGVFVYRNADGTERRELRLPEEVFRGDSLASFGLMPITDDHPPELLTAENTKRYQVGTIADPRRDGDHVRAGLLFTDAATIAKLDGGKVELSCGYTCDLELTPGTWNGERYDAIQRSIRGNHVALVEVGRAGPTARVRMDTGDAAMVASPSQGDHRSPDREKPNMRKIKIDGIEVEVSETAAALFEKFERDMRTKLDSATSEATTAKAALDKVTARADQLDADLKAERTARADADKPEALNKRIAERVALVTEASKHLDKGTKLDTLDDAAIRKLVAEKITGTKLDGKSADYIAARYDAAIESKAKAAVAGARAAANGGEGERTDAGAETDPEKAARERMIERNRGAWRGDKADGAKA